METICPCGSGESYDQCCGKYHSGKAFVETAEELMRSRYSAYVMQCAEYIVDTTHPQKRKPRLKDDIISSWDTIQWVRLEIIKTSQGSVEDKTGKVEFKAFYKTGEAEFVLYELSRFKRHGGRWVYFDGVFLS